MYKFSQMLAITPPLSENYHYDPTNDWTIPLIVGGLIILITVVVIVILAFRAKRKNAEPVLVCPKCDQIMNDDEHFCKKCGTPLVTQANTVYSQKRDNHAFTPLNRQYQKKHRKGMIIAIILLIIEIVTVVLSFSIMYVNKQNAFDAEISNADYDQYGQDYTFTYISNEAGITVTITPTYDIKEFSFTICYYGTSITDTYSEQYEFEFSQAEVPILIFIPAETMNEELWGDFSYARMMHVYGKKQNKNIDNPDHQVHH